VNVNLWAGLGILAFGLTMLVARQAACLTRYRVVVSVNSQSPPNGHQAVQIELHELVALRPPRQIVCGLPAAASTRV
jgi:hypothetical protein